MHDILHKYLLQYKRLPIPGIGLFTIEQAPANLDFINKTLHPPLPVIRFNPGAPVTDKQLFRYLSRHFNLNETDTIRRFNDFAFDFKNDVANNGEAGLAGIGKVAKTSSSDYSFQQESLLDEYFPGIKIERVLRENTGHTIRVGEEEKTSAEMHELLAVEPKKDFWWLYAAILAAAGVAVIVYYHITHKG